MYLGVMNIKYYLKTKQLKVVGFLELKKKKSGIFLLFIPIVMSWKAIVKDERKNNFPDIHNLLM
jgi:hypothetical protein